MPVDEYAENVKDWSNGDINNSKKYAGWEADCSGYAPEENLGDSVFEVQIFSVPLIDEKLYNMAEGARAALGEKVELVAKG